MASPITQRVKTAFVQANKLGVSNDKLVFNLEDKSQVGAEAPPLVEASEGTVTGQMPGKKMTDENWTKYLAQESPERKAERLQQQTDAGVREGVVTQADADTQNAANAEAAKTKEYGTKLPIELDNVYQENRTRSQIGNQLRAEGMIDRKTKRQMNRDYRKLKRQNRKTGLSETDQKTFDYLAKNRKSAGVSDNYNVDASGKITGSKFSDASQNLLKGAGATTKVSGGSQNTQANRDAAVNTGIVNPDGTSATSTIGGDLETINNQKIKTGYKQKAYSGFQQNPKSYNKQAELLDKSGSKLGDVSKTGSFSKVSSAVGPVNQVKAPPVSGGTKFLNKVNKGLNTLPNKGKAGLLKKVGLGLTGVAALTAGYFGGKALLGSSDPEVKPKPEVKPTKKGKSYDQAYQDRDRKTYGHMNKSNYIKEAKRQNDVFGKTGKWDYKNAPKDPGPVGKTLKTQGVVKVGGGSKIQAQPLLDKVAPVAAPVSAPIDNKQKKAIKKIGKLEGRKQTSRRDIRIAKQKDKAAGLSRQEVRKNKQMRKGNFTTTKTSSGSVTGGQAAVNNFISQNENATIKQRENELKASTGFKQKGFSGFQK